MKTPCNCDSDSSQPDIGIETDLRRRLRGHFLLQHVLLYADLFKGMKFETFLPHKNNNIHKCNLSGFENNVEKQTGAGDTI